MHELEQSSARQQIESLIEGAPEDDIDREALEGELRVLDQIAAAPDQLASTIDLFPLFGYTPGTCGVLVSSPTNTLLIAGDAVATREHFLNGQALPDAQDIRAAHEAMGEVYEIADWIIPGHDNLFANPRQMGI